MLVLGWFWAGFGLASNIVIIKTAHCKNKVGKGIYFYKNSITIMKEIQNFCQILLLEILYELVDVIVMLVKQQPEICISALLAILLDCKCKLKVLVKCMCSVHSYNISNNLHIRDRHRFFDWGGHETKYSSVLSRRPCTFIFSHFFPSLCFIWGLYV